MTTEKRQHQRFDARIKVKFKSGNEFAACYSKNISRGGIFLETKVLPDPNATVELVLDLSDSVPEAGAEKLSLKGRVVRLMSVNEGSQTIHKIALQFIDIPHRTQLLLDQYYQNVQE
ncbi:MAG: hypothetical protein COV44_08505 [Deltaproteobacteria bacterium CG11_big_fil_rev_8_21_14_0_20_45_16]|nr:MAG: hypothetical protein COV44_08505 [Deltaproteobacteria bacterium CG11_big_fil_rev_8_21_14_0_20_45_16]